MGREHSTTAPGEESRRIGAAVPSRPRGTWDLPTTQLERFDVSTRSRVAALTGAVLIAATSVGSTLASSHREAPLIAGDPAADNTDLYAFLNPTDPTRLTIIANYVPLEEPAGGPNFFPFDPDVRYQIHIDNTGDGKADITYNF